MNKVGGGGGGGRGGLKAAPPPRVKRGNSFTKRARNSFHGVFANQLKVVLVKLCMQ